MRKQDMRLRSGLVVIGFGCAAWACTASTAHAQSAGDVAAGKAQFTQRCSSCHSLDAATPLLGPHLDGVVGRAAGSATGANYSRAMQSAKFAWSVARLDAFLANPSAVVPGTTMPVNVPEPQVRTDIIAYLATVKRK
jgi:cytochrome c